MFVNPPQELDESYPCNSSRTSRFSRTEVSWSCPHPQPWFSLTFYPPLAPLPPLYLPSQFSNLSAKLREIRPRLDCKVGVWPHRRKPYDALELVLTNSPHPSTHSQIFNIQTLGTFIWLVFPELDLNFLREFWWAGWWGGMKIISIKNEFSRPTQSNAVIFSSTQWFF